MAFATIQQRLDELLSKLGSNLDSLPRSLDTTFLAINVQALEAAIFKKDQQKVGTEIQRQLVPQINKFGSLWRPQEFFLFFDQPDKVIAAYKSYREEFEKLNTPEFSTVPDEITEFPSKELRDRDAVGNALLEAENQLVAFHDSIADIPGLKDFFLMKDGFQSSIAEATLFLENLLSDTAISDYINIMSGLDIDSGIDGHWELELLCKEVDPIIADATEILYHLSKIQNEFIERLPRLVADIDKAVLNSYNKLNRGKERFNLALHILSMSWTDFRDTVHYFRYPNPEPKYLGIDTGRFDVQDLRWAVGGDDKDYSFRKILVIPETDIQALYIGLQALKIEHNERYPLNITFSSGWSPAADRLEISTSWHQRVMPDNLVVSVLPQRRAAQTVGEEITWNLYGENGHTSALVAPWDDGSMMTYWLTSITSEARPLNSIKVVFEHAVVDKQCSVSQKIVNFNGGSYKILICPLTEPTIRLGVIELKLSSKVVARCKRVQFPTPFDSSKIRVMVALAGIETEIVYPLSFDISLSASQVDQSGFTLCARTYQYTLTSRVIVSYIAVIE